jgi:hypothetical protein
VSDDGVGLLDRVGCDPDEKPPVIQRLAENFDLRDEIGIAAVGAAVEELDRLALVLDLISSPHLVIFCSCRQKANHHPLRAGNMSEARDLDAGDASA